MSAARPQLQWVAPSPLWPRAAALAAQSGPMRVPAILRFGSDRFIEELERSLASEPPLLPVAQWESSRLAPAGTLDPASWKAPQPANAAVKLFQPVHGRFYMVAASLVCQQLGLPDHELRVARQERAFFVLRRIQVDAQTRQELAWVRDPKFPADPTKRIWQPVPDQAQRAQLAANEELLPLFPVFVPKTATRPQRRLHAGLIPTSSSDTLASTIVSIPQLTPTAEAEQRVAAPYEAIVATSAHVLENNGLPSHPAPSLQVILDPSNSVSSDPALPLLLQASAFLMLDLADILQKYVPDVFDAILSNGAAPPATSAAGALYRTLQTASADPRKGTTWLQALQQTWTARDQINDPTQTSPALPSFNLFFSAAAVPLSLLRPQLAAAILSRGSPSAPPDPGAASAIVPKFDGNATYVVRCVFQRCAPEAQKHPLLYPALLSEPTAMFEIAPYFDSDAPARMIRIPMPTDTSPAALRRFPKSVGFLLSDQLQRQICQASDLAGLLKGQMSNCPPLQMGQICSFSIPIITIIAMLLMMIMAIVLNFVFWWLPFLKICIPIPKSATTSLGGN